MTNLIPSVEIRLIFAEAYQNVYKISFDGCYTERRIVSDKIIQHDKRSAQQVSSAKYMISAHHINLRTTTPDKKINIAIFDNMDLRKF